MKKEKIFKAKIEELNNVQNFILASLSLNEKLQNQIKIVIEEIFVNIASYAYKNDGDVKLIVSTYRDQFSITFIDSGFKFNPLDNEDPDLNENAKERRIGGLGIFMVKKLMDGIHYKYENNQNILTLVKKY